MSDIVDNTGYGAAVRGAFILWEQGDSRPFFEIVSDDVTWRIIGTTSVSGTYHSKQAVAEATAPLGARFIEPLMAKIKSIHEAGDTVFLQWEGTSHSVNGQPYHQTYCWVIRMAGGKAVDVVVYLDTALVDNMFAD
jgi:uncharacterized protein